MLAKKYELTNHLGSVLAVVTDRRFIHTYVVFATAKVLSATDYFGYVIAMNGQECNGKASPTDVNTHVKGSFGPIQAKFKVAEKLESESFTTSLDLSQSAGLEHSIAIKFGLMLETDKF